MYITEEILTASCFSREVSVSLYTILPKEVAVELPPVYVFPYTYFCDVTLHLYPPLGSTLTLNAQ